MIFLRSWGNFTYINVRTQLINLIKIEYSLTFFISNKNFNHLELTKVLQFEYKLVFEFPKDLQT